MVIDVQYHLLRVAHQLGDLLYADFWHFIAEIRAVIVPKVVLVNLDAKTLCEKEYVMTIDILIKNCIIKLVLHITIKTVKLI